MTQTEIQMAFAHPEARAGSPDRISVRDYTVPIEIGAFQAERGITQRIAFNIVVEVAPPTAQVDDDVDKILSYDRITEAVNDVLSASRFNLLETLAQQVADQILTHDVAQRVFVRIEKLDRGQATLGVEIERLKAQTATPLQGSLAPQPLVIYMVEDAAHSGKLPAYINHLQSLSAPVIICLQKAIETAHLQDAHSQLRVDLLAVEQQAWQFAMRAPHCKVVGTKTELDWGLRNGQIGIWAPSKLVFDTPDAPQDLEQIVPWFAAQMQAQKIIAVGQTISAPFADVIYQNIEGAMQ